MTTSRTLFASTSVNSCENEMSCEDARWPGFWKSVNSANNSKTIMTQRAKFRRLAFIDLPSWSRGSRPLFYPRASACRNPQTYPRPTAYNLGAAGVDAKGTTQDYLTHPSPIPAQIMALDPRFFGAG